MAFAIPPLIGLEAHLAQEVAAMISSQIDLLF